MATTTNLTTLKINYLTQAQYDAALINNEINDNEIYLTPESNTSNTTTWYGTCSTGSTTATKVVTCEGFTLTKGAIISVYFSTANTTSAPSLNVNSTGAKNIYIGNSVCNSTSNILNWSAYTLLTFIYDGTYWKYLTSVSANDVVPSRGGNTWYGTSTTTESTGAKVVTSTNFVKTRGALVSVRFTYGNTSDTLTLNVNGTGAHTVYRGGDPVSSTNPLKWVAYETLTFLYNGTYYYYISSSSNVGQLESDLHASVSCTSGRWFQVAYLTLSPGLWHVDCDALFPATNTSGTRQILVTTATSDYDNVTTAPTSWGNITRDILMAANTAQYPQSHFPVDISTETTFRLIAYQGSGSTVSVTGRMYAVRIK